MELLTILSEYLVAEKTDYSLLISGEWGSGKTFFLKNSLFPKIREINVNNIKKDGQESVNFDPLYISLFGISEIAEIDKRVFLELNPKFKSKPVYFINLIANKITGIFNVKWFDKNDYTDYLSVFSIPSNKILCFDDLERISETILNEALGYINSFVEHQNIKVIIIGDENVLRKKVVEYDKIKEKIIRFTYSFSPDMLNLFDSISGNYPLNYSRYLISNKVYICELFNRGKHNNLRTLKFNLDLFQKIFNIVNSIKKEDKYKIEILDRFIFFATSYSIEYKKINNKADLQDLKHLSSHNILNLKKIDFDSVFKNDEKIDLNPAVKSFSEKFKDIYLPFDSHLYDYYEVIAEYVHTGFLSEANLNIKIDEIIAEIDRKELTEEAIIINKLLNLFTLKDDDLSPLLETVFDKIDKGIFELATYPNILATLLQIEYYNINAFKIDETILKCFEKGIDISKEKAKYVNDFRYRIPIWQGNNAN